MATFRVLSLSLRYAAWWCWMIIRVLSLYDAPV